MHSYLPALTLLILVSATSIACAQAAPPCGDCDRDGDVDIVDALNGAQHAVGLQTLMGQSFTNCDVNLTGSVDVVDALVIAQFSTGLPVPMCGVGGGGGPGTCGTPIVLTSGVPVMGSTVGAPDMSDGECVSIFATNSEKIHSITFTGTRTMDITLSADFSQALYVRTSCAACSSGCGEIGCTDLAGVQMLNLPGLAGGTYYVFVDGRSSGASGDGNYTLTVTLTP